MTKGQISKTQRGKTPPNDINGVIQNHEITQNNPERTTKKTQGRKNNLTTQREMRTANMRLNQYHKCACGAQNHKFTCQTLLKPLQQEEKEITSAQTSSTNSKQTVMERNTKQTVRNATHVDQAII